MSLCGTRGKLEHTKTHSSGCAEPKELLPTSPWDQRSFGVFTALFVFFVVVWVYGIPGYVARHDGVLSAAGVAKRLKGEAATQWAAYQRNRDEYQARINSLDSQLMAGTKSGVDSAALVALRQQYVSEMSVQPPLVLAGMIGNWLNEIWAISYLTLGALIAIWAYPLVRLRLARILSWTFVLYILSLHTTVG